MTDKPKRTVVLQSAADTPLRRPPKVTGPVPARGDGEGDVAAGTTGGMPHVGEVAGWRAFEPLLRPPGVDGAAPTVDEVLRSRVHPHTVEEGPYLLSALAWLFVQYGQVGESPRKERLKANAKKQPQRYAIVRVRWSYGKHAPDAHYRLGSRAARLIWGGSFDQRLMRYEVAGRPAGNLMRDLLPYMDTWSSSLPLNNRVRSYLELTKNDYRLPL